MRIHILTDSCSDIPVPLCEKYGIEIIGINITVGERFYTEMVDVTTEEFWDILEDATEVPATAQITPVRFLERFEAARESGVTHLLVVTMNSKGSGTYNSALIAKQMFCEEYPNGMEIAVLDGRNYSMIFGNAVVHAAELRDKGVPFDEVVKAADALLHKSEAVIVIYTLKHLRKSGRIKGGAAFVGEALGLKPIIYAADCELNVIAKTRGEKGMLPAVMTHVRQNIRQPEEQTLYIAHGKVPEEDIKALEKLVRDEFKPAAIEYIKLGACVTINTGPRVLGIIYHGDTAE